MTSLYLQLHGCSGGESDGGDNTAEDDKDEDEAEHRESLEEHISDLADIVSSFRQRVFVGEVEEEKKSGKDDDDDEDENPMVAMAGLLVNILSSPIGGDETSASKLTREIVRMAWSGALSLACSSNVSDSFVDEDVVNILLEAVCGEDAMGDVDDDDDDDKDGEDDDEDMDEDDSSDEDDTGVFVNANAADLDLDGSDDDEPSKENKKKKNDGEDEEEEEDVELDPSQLENMLAQEESDDDGTPFGILEHHAGADPALAALIKLKQEALKSATLKREQAEISNRFKCAFFLEALFAISVKNSGLISSKVVAGSVLPLMRARRTLAKSVAKAAAAAPLKKNDASDSPRLIKSLTSLLTDKLSKYRRSGTDSDDNAAAVTEAMSAISEEMNRSLDKEHCSCCSAALITLLRCSGIDNVEECKEVREVYDGAVREWCSRKTTKIYPCVFDDLIKKMPSLSRVILIKPLMHATENSYNNYTKSESFRFLMSLYGGGGGGASTDAATQELDQKGSDVLKQNFGDVAALLTKALNDAQTSKAKQKQNVLDSTRQCIEYAKTQKEWNDALVSLGEAIQGFGSNDGTTKVKQICSTLGDAISKLKDAYGNKKVEIVTTAAGDAAPTPKKKKRKSDKSDPTPKKSSKKKSKSKKSD